MKLLAAAMLGRLARWLRLLGYDTAYLPDTDDLAVLRLARAEDRLILTRDRAVGRVRGANALLIDSDSLDDQLCQVLAYLGPPPSRPSSRCPVCNDPLVRVTPEQVAERVPVYVQQTQARFSFCLTCDRVYWRGTHWQHIQAIIGELRDEAGFDTMKSQD